MTWFCPAYKRPHKLAELALSWEECCPNEPLHVRVWSGDPAMKQYMETEWPKAFKFYLSDKETCGEALQEFAEANEGQPIGFIGEDVILRTENAPRLLEMEAGDWYLAWPNDTLQRWQLSTHFCIGPLLLKALRGVLVPKEFPHHYLDMRLKTIADNCGLERYRPDIIFYHKHPFAQRTEVDEVYLQADEQFQAAGVRWEGYRETLKKEIHTVRTIMTRMYERGLE